MKNILRDYLYMLLTRKMLEMLAGIGLHKDLRNCFLFGTYLVSS